MSFQSLGLSEPIVRAVHELGYTDPTPIQMQAIPAVLAGGDLLAGAQTGTGKTAGFTLPILERLNASRRAAGAAGKRAVRALILTPTRELAAQVEQSVREYGKHLSLKSTVLFGGVGIQPQIDALRRGVDIVVATPGRLLDHMQQKTIDVAQLEILVLDEADRMLDMGFIHDIKRVLARLPAKRQNLLFSATFSDEIKSLADSLLDTPALIEVARRNTTAELVSQKIYPVDRDRKRELLTHLIRQHAWFQVLVFTRTKHGANRLAEQLTKDGISALAIHGNKSQSARTRALAEFKDGTLQVLVATDIAARGIDIDQLPHVVNYDLPNVPEDYVHRIGRTGRAGASGEAVSLVCVDEHQLLKDIEKLIKRSVPREVIPGFEPDPHAKPEPIQQRRAQGGNRQPRAAAPQAREPRAGSGASGDPGNGRRTAAAKQADAPQRNGRGQRADSSDEHKGKGTSKNSGKGSGDARATAPATARPQRQPAAGGQPARHTAPKERPQSNGQPAPGREARSSKPENARRAQPGGASHAPREHMRDAKAGEPRRDAQRKSPAQDGANDDWHARQKRANNPGALLGGKPRSTA